MENLRVDDVTGVPVARQCPTSCIFCNKDDGYDTCFAQTGLKCASSTVIQTCDLFFSLVLTCVCVFD